MIKTHIWKAVIIAGGMILSVPCFFLVVVTTISQLEDQHQVIRLIALSISGICWIILLVGSFFRMSDHVEKVIELRKEQLDWSKAHKEAV